MITRLTIENDDKTISQKMDNSEMSKKFPLEKNEDAKNDQTLITRHTKHSISIVQYINEQCTGVWTIQKLTIIKEVYVIWNRQYI